MGKLTRTSAVIIWASLIAFSLLWNYLTLAKSTRDISQNKAEAVFDQILVTRLWNAGHGGVYVPVTPSTQPNPYLADTLRDIISTEGFRFTMVNPAFMTRQISELADRKNDLRFHITSTNPIRPANEPDEWELAALLQFEAGEPAVFDHVIHSGQKEYRYMAPLYTEQSCLQCHAVQGYNLGDIRGGISISFPSLPYHAAMNYQMAYFTAAHLFILLIGLLGIIRYFSTMKKLFGRLYNKNRDLLNEKQLLADSNQTLSEIKAEKDRLLTVISHDLRGPIANIAGLSELILEETQNKNYQNTMQLSINIQKSSQMAMDLLSNLLEWSRLKLGGTAFAPQPTNIALLLDNEAENMLSLASRKQIHIETSTDIGIIAPADPFMLQTVVRNLLSNAIKFSHPHSMVQMVVKKYSKQVQVSVIDQGVGISDYDSEKLFDTEAAFTSKGTANEQGTGLGLLLCKAFIDKHGGKIWAESEIGKGSTFHFTLPVTANPSTDNQT